jgi:hypothetical protein
VGGARPSPVSRLRRPMARSARLILLCALLAGVIAGCGANSETGIQTAATDEGQYLEVGGLKYQVQISRELNPTDNEDRSYLLGVPSGVQPAPGEIWFGVFMRVQNDGDRPARATSDFTITDTQNNTFRPVPLGSQNVFAYRAHTLQPGELIPLVDSAAATDPIQGSLILFKLQTDSLQNRPLKLTIAQAGEEPAVIDLDL